jgi:Kef-type K+ transport system membrane component KefB
MSLTEVFLLAMLLIFSIPYMIWRVFRTDYYAPLVVVQIATGILLGPGVLGAAFPNYYNFVFSPGAIQALSGIAWWAVMIFVFVAGVELDLRKAWSNRWESGVTAGLALGSPLVLGSIVAAGMLLFDGWIGGRATRGQFVLGVGMACAVTALPILILLMEKLEILRQPIGQRILRYASLDDVAIWGVLALILLDWVRVGRQVGFIVVYALASYGVRKLMLSVQERDRWYIAFIWLALCGLAADWSGFHFMVGAFLAGVVIDADWFDQKKMDMMRDHILMTIMPVFFLSTGLRTNWSIGSEMVLVAALALLAAQIAGKLLGVHIAGKILKWPPGEASIIGWLLQTKALIMIIFVNILLDKDLITAEAFTALLLMAIASTMLTIPVVSPKLQAAGRFIFQTMQKQSAP